jgi:hypothetical protein
MIILFCNFEVCLKNRVKGLATKMGDIFSRLCLFLAKITNCAYKHVYRIKKKYPSACQIFLRRICRHVFCWTPPPFLLYKHAPINDECPLMIGKLPLHFLFGKVKPWLFDNASIKYGCVPIPIPNAIGFSSLEIWKSSVLFYVSYFD